MIRFSCRCGYVFEAPADAAGIGLQCPDCHLLNDVPFLGDLSNIAGDGTYKVDAQPQETPPEALGDLLHVYGNKTIDDAGQPTDLRTLPDDTEDIGEYETSDNAARRQRPRYDPETGELVKAIPIAKDHDQSEWIDPSTIPFARAAISYAANGAIRAKSGTSVLLDLLQPMSLVVMAFVLGFHLLIALATVAIAMRFLHVAPIELALIFALIAHYGNVIDEIGPGGIDELPRLMRDLQMFEDIFHPLFCVLGTAMICYGPAIAFAFKSSLSLPATAAIAAALAIAGTFFLPAILLTSLTSGSAANLRPDRILGVIRHAGTRYFGLIIAFVIALVPYLWAISAFTILAYKAWGIDPLQIPNWATMWPVALPLLCLGIFGMHFFCWQLGMLYRLRGDAFPWINQFHARAPKPPVRRRKPKYVAGSLAP